MVVKSGSFDWVLLDQCGLFFLSSIQVLVLLVSMSSFLEQEGKFLDLETLYSIMARRFPVWYLFSVVLSKSMCISTFDPSSSPSNSLVILFIHSAFPLCSFGCHIFFQNCSVFCLFVCFFASGCFRVISSHLLVEFSFVFFLHVLFCLYCFYPLSISL